MNDSRFVVKPHMFFETEFFAMYISDYVDNALCVANNYLTGCLGVYNPLPNYHFEDFTSDVADKVNISRIAHLVNSFNFDELKGVSKTQISGNDFMLTQDVNFDDLDSIINNMRIISARDFHHSSFQEYLNLIRFEFEKSVCRDSQEVLDGSFKINHHSKMLISKSIIEEGILRGLDLIDKR